MTAFSEREHAMLWGIYGELDTMNRSLTLLVELLERQEKARHDADHSEFQIVRTIEVAPDVDIEPPETRAVPLPDVEDELRKVKATRRANGWCLLCGATRVNAGEGCYEIENTPNGPKTWMGHSWPEDEARWAGQSLEDGRGD